MWNSEIFKFKKSLSSNIVSVNNKEKSSHCSRKCLAIQGLEGEEGILTEAACVTTATKRATSLETAPKEGVAVSSTCYNCNQSGQISRDCTHNEQGEWGGGRGGRRGRGGRGGRGRSCFNCDEVGHIARDCPQKRFRRNGEEEEEEEE
ncbi:DNA-binding protein HEXBP [Armadillidium vulgare]|nr:DNA-binding protein HEXBP [Armadillidium vulgare]